MGRIFENLEFTRGIRGIQNGFKQADLPEALKSRIFPQKIRIVNIQTIQYRDL